MSENRDFAAKRVGAPTFEPHNSAAYEAWEARQYDSVRLRNALITIAGLSTTEGITERSGASLYIQARHIAREAMKSIPAEPASEG